MNSSTGRKDMRAEPEPGASPGGLQPPPRRAPRRLQTTGDLRVLQRLMAHALVRPLAPKHRQPPWIDGRPMEEVAAEFIRPNDRLTALERLEIYHRMYWFRLIDCATDDCPGLRSVLGARRFERLVRAYLAKYPSRSFTAPQSVLAAAAIHRRGAALDGAAHRAGIRRCPFRVGADGRIRR